MMTEGKLYNLTELYKSYGRKKTSFDSFKTRYLNPFAELNNLTIKVVKGGNGTYKQGTFTESKELYDLTVQWAQRGTIKKETFIRSEHQFGEDIIKNLFRGYEIKEQFPCGSYFIDWYIPELNLAVEFDEPQHTAISNMKKDLERQRYIEKKLNCKFIRYTYKP